MSIVQVQSLNLITTLIQCKTLGISYTIAPEGASKIHRVYTAARSRINKVFPILVYIALPTAADDDKMRKEISTQRDYLYTRLFQSGNKCAPGKKKSPRHLCIWLISSLYTLTAARALISPLRSCANCSSSSSSRHPPRSLFSRERAVLYTRANNPFCPIYIYVRAAFILFFFSLSLRRACPSGGRQASHKHPVG